MTGSPADWPLVTVMIPVRNESRFIVQTLSQIAQQDYPANRLEILVVDGMSDDGTPELVRDFAKDHRNHSVRLLENPLRLSSAARNIAVKEGRGDYILLIDGHVYIPGQTLVRDMVEAAKKKDARCLGRPQPLNPPDIGPFQEMVALSRESPIAHSQESFIYSDFEGWTSPISIGVMYRRDVFAEVGLFDENFDAAEDLEFNYRVERAGIRCYTSPKFAVRYYPRESFGGLCRQMRRYGRGRAGFIAKHPERFRIETVVPAGFVAAMATLAIGGLFWLPFWMLLLFLGSLYGAILIAEGFRLARRRARFFSWKIPAIIACVHLGLGLGFLEGSPRFFRGWTRPA